MKLSTRVFWDFWKVAIKATVEINVALDRELKIYSFQVL